MTQAGATKCSTGIVSTALLARSRPEIQWIGASKCVPVCSPHEKLFQYQPGPRASYAETSSIRNGQHCPISGGSAICGNSGESVCVRSTTRMRRAASAATSCASSVGCAVVRAFFVAVAVVLMASIVARSFSPVGASAPAGPR